MAIKENDFIVLDYTGKEKESGVIFDTTIEEVGKKEKLNQKFEPITVCIGRGHILKGLEKGLIGKEPGEYHISVKTEDGYGRKNPKFLKLIPAAKFKKENINPQPGLHVNIDNAIGVIRTVNGGRVIVDFNHPLASKDLEYDVKVHKIVTDEAEKIKGLLELLQFPNDDVTVTGKKAVISFPSKILDDVAKNLTREITELTNVTEVEYTEKKKETKKEVAVEEKGDEKNEQNT